jgi:NAD+ synthetase
MTKEMLYETYDNIVDSLSNYILKNNIKALVIGISGGIDSAVNANICHRICSSKIINIPLIGRYLKIDGNSIEEEERAVKIGEAFCGSDFKVVDLNDEFKMFSSFLKSSEHSCFSSDSLNEKIRMGNIKARVRMIYLRDVAQINFGMVIDNDNYTEHQLGFWTLDGDVGDYAPLSSLYKTEVYDMASILQETTNDEKEKKALEKCITAIPTDGLGITDSDLTQLHAKSYEIVDNLLMDIGFDTMDDIKEKKLFSLYTKYGKETTDSIIERHFNSEYKRNIPIRPI